MLSGIIVVICIIVVLGFLSKLDSNRYEREKENQQLIRKVNESFRSNEDWRSLRILDALSAGASIEFIDIAKNKIIIKTPDGLVEAMVNRDNLPHFLRIIKLAPKQIYKYSDCYINMNLDTKEVIIDKIKYSNN